jgi:radical SAM protein with 4Fe4S-binding SPASM domain
MGDSFYIQWHITNVCNLRCQHCYQDDFSKKTDLDWARLKKISDNLLNSMKEWKREACIHLTGGEPLLKPELFPLLNDLNQQAMVEELGVITNGIPIDQEMVRKFSGFSKLKKIKISLDGGDAETNDSIRQRGTFKKVMERLPWIKKEKRFEIILMFTAMKKNFKSLPSLLKLCEDLDIDGLIIERFIPLGIGKEITNEVLSQGEWKEMIGMLLDLFQSEGEDHYFFPYQAFQVTFSGREPELLGAPCVIGRDGICVMPNGDVLPCRRFPISIGNLLTDSFSRIWEKSELLKKLRRKENLKGKCRSCEIKECRGCRSLALALTGDYLGEDPHCRHHAI